MTLTLNRVDYARVGVTSRGTTKLLPTSEAKQMQKFVVGDHDGVLHIYGMKKGELQLIFKSLPGKKISCLCLGGTFDAPRDKIFISCGNSVKGFTRKGKLFLEFDTSLIDSITAMYVHGADLAACARDLYHRYRDCKDADSYLCGENLRDVLLVPIDSNTIIAILACEDCAVRVLQGTKSPTVLRISSIPTILTLHREGDNESQNRILMGTSDGRIGLLLIQGNKTLRLTWLIVSTGSEITSIDTHEIQDTVDIIVGRVDGTIQVYTYPEDEDPGTATIRFRYNAGESISTIIGGTVGAHGYPEILVTTYSGRIFGLTTRPPALIEAEHNANSTIMKLKAEIRQLEEKLNEDKDQSLFAQSTETLTPLILSVNHRMALIKEDASYSLSVELDTSIDNILIQSDTPIKLIDVDGNGAVVSLSDCDSKEGNFVLATYRCQVNTNRLEAKLRTIEGQPGTLQVYVTSQIQPKCCRRIIIPICALSLHMRYHEDQEKNPLLGGPFNELRMTGNFTIAEMHAWLSLALPDIPGRPHIVDGEASLIYVSSFIGTILKCKYKKGSANFLGESISTIIILRDILTREATKRKIKLDVFCDVVEASLSRVLDLILPRLETVANLAKSIKILDALQDWELKSNPRENLSSEYQELIKNETNLRSQMHKDTELSQRLYGLVTDLYVDWERAKGSRRISSKIAAEKLSVALDSADRTLLMKVILGKDYEESLNSMTSGHVSLQQETLRECRFL